MSWYALPVPVPLPARLQYSGKPAKAAWSFVHHSIRLHRLHFPWAHTLLPQSIPHIHNASGFYKKRYFLPKPRIAIQREFHLQHRHFPARPQALRRQPYHTLHMQAFHTTLLPVSGKYQAFATFPFPSSFCFIEKTNMIIQYKIYAIQASGIRKACMHPSTYLCACGR